MSAINNDIINKSNDFEDDKTSNHKLLPKFESIKSPEKINETSNNNKSNNETTTILNTSRIRKSPRSYSNESRSSNNSIGSSASNNRKQNQIRSNSKSPVSSKSNYNLNKIKSPDRHNQYELSSISKRASPHYHHQEPKHSHDRLSSPANKYHYGSDNHHHLETKKSSSQRRSHSLEKYSNNEYNNYFSYTNNDQLNDDRERERYAGEYTSICLKNLNEKINIDELKQAIYDLFGNYRKFSVKVVNNKKSSTSIERIAFVNFSSHQDAKSAKRSKMNKSFYGYQLYIEPVFHSYTNSYTSRKSPSPTPLNHHYRDVDRHDYKSSPPSRYNHHTRSPPSQHYYQPFSNYYNNQYNNNNNNNNNSILRQRSRSQSPPLPIHPVTPPPQSKSKHRSDSVSSRKRHSRSTTPTRNLGKLKKSTLSPTDKYYYNKKNNYDNRTPSPTIIRRLISPPRNITKRHRSRSKSIDNNDLNTRKHAKYNISPKREPVSSSYHYYHSRIKEPIYSSTTYNHVKYSRSPSPPPKYPKHRYSRSRSRSKRNSPIPPHHYSSSSSSSKHMNQNYFDNNRVDRHYYDLNDLSYKLNSQSSKHYYHHPPSPPPIAPIHHHHHHSTEYDRNHQYDYKLQQQHQNLHQGGVTHYFDNDEKDATRTLFIGNLDNDIDRSYLEKIFERYGRIEDIEIKRNQSVQPPYMYHHGSSSSSSNSNVKKTYAFIKYEFMDMAISAKKHLNNKLIGKNEIKIGFGKVQATNCLWIGGLTENTRRKELERELKYFASLVANNSSNLSIEIDWIEGRYYCYALFQSVKQAEEVRFQLRGKCLANSGSNKLRIDFAEVKNFKRSNRQFIDHEPHSRRTSNERTIYKKVRSPSSSPQHCNNHSNKRSRSPLPHLTVSSRQLKSPLTSRSPLSQTNHSPKQSRRVITNNKLPAESASSNQDQDSSLNILSTRKLNKSSSEPNCENDNSSKLDSDETNVKFNKLENFTITTIDNMRRIDFQLNSNSTNVSTPITSVAIEEIEKINDKFVKDENNFLDNLNEIKTEIVTVNDSSFNVSQNEVRENNSNINNDIQNVLQIVIDDKKNLDLSIDASANLLSQQSDTTLNNDKDTDDKKNAVNFINKQEDLDIFNKIPELEQLNIKIQSKKSLNLSKSSKSPDSTTALITDNIKNNIQKDEEGEIVDDEGITSIQNIKNIFELTKCISGSEWSGSFTLKKHTFPIKFYLITGNKSYKNQIFKQIQSTELHINQRLRLDSSKLEDIEKKINDSILSNSLNSIYIALPNYNSSNELQHQRNLHNLISYLDQKGAAGVIPLPDDDKPTVTIHLFTPNSSFSSKIIKKLFPSLLFNNEQNNNSDFLIIVLLKAN